VRRFAIPFLLLLALGHSLSAAELDEEKAALERIRGLTFTGPVKTEAIDRSELPGRIREQLARGLVYSPQDWEIVLRALLLIDDDKSDPMQAMIDLYQAQALAYYDPATRTFYSIRQMPAALQDLPPGLAPKEMIVVHELMHALQDQRYAIGRRDRDLRHDTDASLAYHAFLEGEASLVMLAFMVDKMGASFDDVVTSPLVTSLLANAATTDLAGAPPYFAELLKFPYLEGLKFVLEAYKRGGWKELDKVHQRPPRSTREILHPEEYFAAEAPRPAPSFPRGGEKAEVTEHLGEFHWAYLLGAENAEGWVDDLVTITFDSACNPIVAIRTRWDSPAAARRFHDAYRQLLHDRKIGAITYLDDSAVRVTYVP
jgi:hypothetical protein